MPLARYCTIALASQIIGGVVFLFVIVACIYEMIRNIFVAVAIAVAFESNHVKFLKPASDVVVDDGILRVGYGFA